MGLLFWFNFYKKSEFNKRNRSSQIESLRIKRLWGAGNLKDMEIFLMYVECLVL